MKNDKNKLRCSLSGKLIGNSDEVVKAKYVEEYLIKQGYKVIRPQTIYLVYSLTYCFIILGAILIR